MYSQNRVSDEENQDAEGDEQQSSDVDDSSFAEQILQLQPISIVWVGGVKPVVFLHILGEQQ